MKLFLIELGLSYFVKLMKDAKSPKVKEFLLNPKTFTTVKDVSDTYFKLYDKLTNEN